MKEVEVRLTLIRRPTVMHILQTNLLNRLILIWIIII
nr:MAG TPA: hypothetical protein [Bacteriophage sp.]